MDRPAHDLRPDAMRYPLLSVSPAAHPGDFPDEPVRPRPSANGLIPPLHHLYGGCPSLYPIFMPDFLFCAHERNGSRRPRGRGIDGSMGKEFLHESAYFPQEPWHAVLRRG